MHIIVGNYGNHTLALMQWAHEERFSNIFVVNVDTGWAEKCWSERVSAGKYLADSYGFQTVTLSSPADFAELVRDRQQFPLEEVSMVCQLSESIAAIRLVT